MALHLGAPWEFECTIQCFNIFSIVIIFWANFLPLVREQMLLMALFDKRKSIRIKAGVWTFHHVQIVNNVTLVACCSGNGHRLFLQLPSSGQTLKIMDDFYFIL